MRVLCRHGHFAFYPRRAKDVCKFITSFNIELEREEDYYTFPELVDTPDYSILGKVFVNLPAIKTFEGKPWEVMKENDFVFHLGLKKIVPKLGVVGVVDIISTGFYFMIDSPLLQPGYRTTSGSQILSYSAELFEDDFRLKVLEFAYE